MSDSAVKNSQSVGSDAASQGGGKPPFSNGLIWAVHAVPGEGLHPLGSDEVQALLSAEEIEPEQGWYWLHFDTVHSATRAYVGHLHGLPENVRGMLAEIEYGVALEVSDEQLVWGSFPAFDDVLAEEDGEICAWRFAMRPKILITTRRIPIPLLGAAYRALRPDTIPRTPAGMIDRILQEFTGTVRRQLTQLDDELDRAEDGLLTMEHRADLGYLGGVVGKVRRRATELRRVVVSVDRVLRDEDLELPLWAEDDLRDRAERQVHTALDDLIALQDRARSLQDELSSSQAEETNRSLYIVSVSTTLMLPATFVTGFFGMNTGGMFLTHGSWGTVLAGGVCFVFMAVTFLFMKLARLL